jgi:hypothetical protein
VAVYSGLGSVARLGGHTPPSRLLKFEFHQRPTKVPNYLASWQTKWFLTFPFFWRKLFILTRKIGTRLFATIKQFDNGTIHQFNTETMGQAKFYDKTHINKQ